VERNRQDHRNCVISKVASKFLDDDLFRGWKVSEIEVRVAREIDVESAPISSFLKHRLLRMRTVQIYGSRGRDNTVRSKKGKLLLGMDDGHKHMLLSVLYITSSYNLHLSQASVPTSAGKCLHI
jgi:hypothetical protein